MLLALAKEAGVKRVINGSSSSVFGIKEESDVEETLEPAPLTSYSKIQNAIGMAVRHRQFPEFCSVNIRPATICGVSRQRFDLTVNKLTADAVTKKVITVHGGQQRRPNVGMTDIVNLYAELVTMDPAKINGRTFNFGFENHKVIDIAKIIQEELSDLCVRVDITETFDNRDYHISSKKILNELGYKPVSSIRHEVAALSRKALERGDYEDIDAPQHYNMKSMEMESYAAATNTFPDESYHGQDPKLQRGSSRLGETQSRREEGRPVSRDFRPSPPWTSLPLGGVRGAWGLACCNHHGRKACQQRPRPTLFWG